MAATSFLEDQAHRTGSEHSPADLVGLLRPTITDGTVVRDKTSPLETPVEVKNTPSDVSPASNGTRLLRGHSVGPYTVLRRLGEGGFAVVHLAEQQSPLRRRVALKLLKPGMETQEILARFEAERQALALMDHPHIAEIFDAGVTEDGRPYFAMELVEGTPITEFCDAHQLTIDQRLRLFVQVCDAVQHAHHKAVIHRDLKPSNVLVKRVDGKPVPKIIDFGIAKAVGQKLSEATIQTELGALMGTPTHMSPEQVNLGDGTTENIDTRADVYALGTILYELLAGELPFGSPKSGLPGLMEMLQSISEHEAPKPSSRIAQRSQSSNLSARVRSTEVPTLRRKLTGDLDWITLMALEKDRERRYNSPNDLAEDIEHYLTDQPVRARPPSKIYVARKFVRRNTTAVVASLATVLVLIVSTISTTVQAQRIKVERDAAQRAQAELEQVVRFQSQQLSDIDPEHMGIRLRQDLLASVRTSIERNGAPEAVVEEQIEVLRKLLDRANFTDLALHALEENIFQSALETLHEQFVDQPLIEARLLQTLSQTTFAAGLFDTAISAQEEALEMRRRELGYDHPDTLTSAHNMGALLIRLDPTKAETYILESLERRREILGDDHPDTLTSFNSLGTLRQAQGRYDEAETLYRETLERRRGLLGHEDADTLASINNLGNFLLGRGDLDGAEPILREALETSRRVLGEAHPQTLAVSSNMGSLLYLQGKLAEAEPIFREVLEIRRRLLGAEHRQTLRSLHNLGALLMGLDRFAAAEPHLREAMVALPKILGPAHPSILNSLNALSWVLIEQNQYAEAEQLLREHLPAHREFMGDDHWQIAEAHSLLGEALAGLGNHRDAEEYLLSSYSTLEVSLPSTRRAQSLQRAKDRLVVLYTAWGQPDRAAEWRGKATASAIE